MSIYEYDAKRQRKFDREEGREEGREEVKGTVLFDENRVNEVRSTMKSDNDSSVEYCDWFLW